MIGLLAGNYSLTSWVELLIGWLVLTSIKYHDNLLVLILLITKLVSANHALSNLPPDLSRIVLTNYCKTFLTG